MGKSCSGTTFCCNEKGNDPMRKSITLNSNTALPLSPK